MQQQYAVSAVNLIGDQSLRRVLALVMPEQWFPVFLSTKSSVLLRLFFLKGTRFLWQIWPLNALQQSGLIFKDVRSEGFQTWNLACFLNFPPGVMQNMYNEKVWFLHLILSETCFIQYSCGTKGWQQDRVFTCLNLFRPYCIIIRALKWTFIFLTHI